MFFSSLSLFAVRSYPEEMDSTPQFDVWFALGFERGIVCEGTIRVSQGTASCRVYQSQGGVRRTGNAESARMFCLLWGTNKMDSFHQRDTELASSMPTSCDKPWYLLSNPGAESASSDSNMFEHTAQVSLDAAAASCSPVGTHHHHPQYALGPWRSARWKVEVESTGAVQSG